MGACGALVVHDSLVLAPLPFWRLFSAADSLFRQHLQDEGMDLDCRHGRATQETAVGVDCRNGGCAAGALRGEPGAGVLVAQKAITNSQLHYYLGSARL